MSTQFNLIPENLPEEYDDKSDQEVLHVDSPEPDEPSHDDSVNFCPNCERPNQFGELCVTCQREEQEAIDAGER